MKYDGVVIRFSKESNLYLFILDPDSKELQDGINISEHRSYQDMNQNQLMVTEVTLKDGTEEMDKIDLQEFIHGDSYGRYDVFIHIKDIMLYSIGENENFGSNITLEKIAKRGNLSEVAINCIEISKQRKNLDV